MTWLDRAIVKAGYTKRANVVTKAEQRATVRLVVTAMKEVGGACEATCGQFIVDRLQEAMARLERGTGAAE